jgi:hypothetical protein
VVSIDLAPTLLHLAGFAAPSMDGRSFIPLLRHAATARSADPRSTANSAAVAAAAADGTGAAVAAPIAGAHASGRSFLVEYWPIPTHGTDTQVRPSFAGSGTRVVCWACYPVWLFHRPTSHST